MTKDEWLECTTPEPMLASLRWLVLRPVADDDHEFLVGLHVTFHPQERLSDGMDQWDARLVLERVRDQIEELLVIEVRAVIVLLRSIGKRKQGEAFECVVPERRQITLLKQIDCASRRP